MSDEEAADLQQKLTALGAQRKAGTMMEEFHKVRRLPPYVFEQVNRLKAARERAAPTSSISAWATPTFRPRSIVDKLVESVQDPRTHRYSASKGIPGLRRAQAAYYARRFGVKLNPDTQVVATLGSKEGFANMAQAITAPGDVVLVPEPELSDPRLRLPDGGRRHPLDVRSSRTPASSRRWSAREAFDPEADRARHSAIRRTRRPTSRRSISTRTSSPSRRSTSSSCCPISPIPRSISTTTPPPSMLQVPGAMDVAVEFTSMSKTFSMAGWRMGFAVGNERLIAALTRVKSYLDYGAFTPIQVAATPR
jgi:alanine-synthesizing transaminase